MFFDGSQNLDIQERAREKQRSRRDDERALELRAKSAEQLRRENGHFAGLNAKVALKRGRSLY
ncbi:hypothetical protein ACIHQR_06150 [Corallococcus coralloides]|uniref:hypothetical protein n=1 Tax=Corallococcus coralloides TaxID=184914 RepID=UPI00384ABBB3